MPGESNYIHEDEIWRQRLKNETEGAAVWHENWGFLAGREQPEPRGFSTNVAKYSYGQAQWSVKTVRVPDNTREGLAAAESEQNARKMMSKLSWKTQPANPTKACDTKVRPPPAPSRAPRVPRLANALCSPRRLWPAWTGASPPLATALTPHAPSSRGLRARRRVSRSSRAIRRA